MHDQDTRDEMLEHLIQTHGMTVQHKCVSLNGQQYHASYTVGLRRNGNHEVILFGLPPKVAEEMLHQIDQQLKVEAITPLKNGYGLERIANRPLAIRNLIPGICEKLGLLNTLGMGYQQIVLPDNDGHFPWSENYDAEAMAMIQPELWEYDPTEIKS